MSEGKQKIEVDAYALFTVLKALLGPPHHIRELQATLPPYLGPNPINLLADEYNAWVDAQNKPEVPE